MAHQEKGRSVEGKTSVEQQRTRPEWRDFKTLTDPETGVKVIIQKLPLFKGPNFNHRIGFTGKAAGGNFTPYGSTQITYDLASMKMEPHQLRAIGEALIRMSAEYDAVIGTEAQASHDRNVENRIAREQKQANWGKKDARVTGKTARKKGKAPQPATASHG